MKSIKSTMALGLALAALPLTGWSYAFESSAQFASCYGGGNSQQWVFQAP
jgi:hypothetical protein